MRRWSTLKRIKAYNRVFCHLDYTELQRHVILDRCFLSLRELNDDTLEYIKFQTRVPYLFAQRDILANFWHVAFTWSMYVMYILHKV